MPAKPLWFSNLDRIIAELEALPRTWVDRATVEAILGVGPRRAQQIMAPCITERVGSNGLTDRTRLIEHLRQLGAGEEGHYERRRRRKVGEELERLRRAWLETPKVLVEAPVSIASQQFDDLPAGVELSPGRIIINFKDPREALEKLLALAMAIGNDQSRFEGLTAIL